MQEYSNAVIITVDDVCLYETRLVEKLMEVHTMNQNCVCCNMAHKITLKTVNQICTITGRGNKRKRYVRSARCDWN